MDDSRQFTRGDERRKKRAISVTSQEWELSGIGGEDAKGSCGQQAGKPPNHEGRRRFGAPPHQPGKRRQKKAGAVAPAKRHWKT